MSKFNPKPVEPSQGLGIRYFPSLDELKFSQGIQQQGAGFDQVALSQDMEAVADVWSSPPNTAFHAQEGRNWLADCFHRAETAKRLKNDEITAEKRGGRQCNVILLACGASATHGLPRSNADKREAVAKLLADPEGGVGPIAKSRSGIASGRFPKLHKPGQNTTA